MTVYGVTFASLLLLSMLYHLKWVRKNKKAIIMSMGLVLVCVAGLRYLVGTDYTHYVRGYNLYITKGITSLLAQPGVAIVAKATSWIKTDYALWFFVMAMICILPAIQAINKYSVSPDFSVLLFLLMGCWNQTLNLVKQSAAAAILLLGYGALRDRKIVVWVILCLIGTIFHFSALFMLPVYFLVTAKVSKKTILAILSVGVVTMLFYDRLFDVVSFLKSGENMLSIKSAMRNTSVNTFRVLVNCAPLLLCILYRKRCPFDDRGFGTMFNMSLLNVALNIGAMNSIYIYRICSYTNIFNVFFIPQITSRIKPRNKRIVVFVMVVLYFAFWWYDLKKGSTTAVFHWIFER